MGAFGKLRLHPSLHNGHGTHAVWQSKGKGRRRVLPAPKSRLLFATGLLDFTSAGPPRVWKTRLTVPRRWKAIGNSLLAFGALRNAGVVGAIQSSEVVSTSSATLSGVASGKALGWARPGNFAWSGIRRCWRTCGPNELCQYSPQTLSENMPQGGGNPAMDWLGAGHKYLGNGKQYGPLGRMMRLFF